MAKHRMDRVNADAQRVLAEVVRDLKDPRIPLMTSVTQVRVTEDFKFAKVYVSVLGSEAERKDAIKGLSNAAGYCRKELASRLNLRHTPQLTFLPDDSIEYGAKINNILKDIAVEDNNAENN